MESYDVIANQPVVIDNVCTLVLLLIVFFPLEIGYKLPVFTADMFDGGRHDSPAVQWSSDGFHVSCGWLIVDCNMHLTTKWDIFLNARHMI